MKAYTIKEQRFILENHGKLSLREIAAALGRTKSSVTGHLRRIGVRLPEDVRTSRKRIGCFKPGGVPFNKGKKGHMKANATSFRKGNQPHNTKHDGAESIRVDTTGRQYRYIRLAKAKWVPLHRHLWEQANGPVPAGYIVVFRDGNSLNCELSNLELISRAENVRRNHNRPKAAESMKKRWKIKKTLEPLKKEFPNLFN